MPDSRIPERLLRFLWQRQLLSRRGLRTTDGVPLEILSPGQVNTDGGPDFHDARIRIGGTLFRGDVEVHVRDASWHSHRHASDPHYNGVILHVVFDAAPGARRTTTASGRTVPLLEIRPLIDASLLDHLTLPPRAPLLCAPVNDGVPGDLIGSWLLTLARERLEFRVRALTARLHELIDAAGVGQHTTYTPEEYADHAPWEQLLYEGLMEGMGYRGNSAPFLRLARSVPLATLRLHDVRDTYTMQAILFGAAGLLPPPKDIADRESRAMVRGLRSRWQELRPSLRIPLLHEADWLFFRLRPANFPTARLASFSYCLPSLFAPGAVASLLALFAREDLPLRALRREIAARFRFVPDAYWSAHRHFRSRGNGIALGRERIIDCAAGTVVPLVVAHGRLFGTPAAPANALALFHALPVPRWNAVTRTVKEDLLKDRVRAATFAHHQGMLQLHKFYCRPERCSGCAVGAVTFSAASFVPRGKGCC